MFSLVAGETDINKLAVKLHRQFGHLSKDKLLGLIKSAGITDGDFKDQIVKVSNSCKSCLLYKKNPARPVVSLPLATEFNETVSMDLKKYKDFYFLVLVDMATRYTQACVLKNKQPQSVIRGVFKFWISFFWISVKIF